MSTLFESTKLEKKDADSLLKQNTIALIEFNKLLTNLTKIIMAKINYTDWINEHQSKIALYNKVIIEYEEFNFLSPYSPYDLYGVFALLEYDEKLQNMQYGKTKYISYNAKNLKKYDEGDVLNGIYIFIKSLLYILTRDINSYGNATKMLNIDMLSYANRIIALKYIKYLNKKYKINNNLLDSYIEASEEIIKGINI